MLLGIGKVPGLIAVCIYAIPPIVRLTNLGIGLSTKVLRLRMRSARITGAAPASGAAPSISSPA